MRGRVRVTGDYVNRMCTGLMNLHLLESGISACERLQMVLRLSIIQRRVSPLSGEVLSLACPRESTQRERHPVACPVINLRLMTGYPALLGKTGARATRDLAALDYAQTGRELFPVSPAMLGCARRASNPATFVVGALFECDQILIATRAIGLRVTPTRPVQPSIACRVLRSGILEMAGEPPCLSWICKPPVAANPASSASAQIGRSTGNPRQRASLRILRMVPLIPLPSPSTTAKPGVARNSEPGGLPAGAGSLCFSPNSQDLPRLTASKSSSTGRLASHF